MSTEDSNLENTEWFPDLQDEIEAKKTALAKEIHPTEQKPGLKKPEQNRGVCRRGSPSRRR